MMDKFRVWAYMRGHWALTQAWGWLCYLWFHVLPAEERREAKRGFWEAYHKARKGEDVVIPGRGRR